MKARYRDVLAVIPDEGTVEASVVAEQTRFSHLDTRWILNALQHQGLVFQGGGRVWLTEPGRRLKGRVLCIPSV